jgi:undecaprenyl diphosphate synthase
MTDSSMPRHVGLILDGNRRWAAEHGLPANQGHLQGLETLKKVVKAGFDSGVNYITAYAFSTENWKRTRSEIKFLMSLLLRFVDRDLDQLHKDGVRVVILGSRYGLSKKILKAIEKTEELTKNNQKGVLAVCFNYGGQAELVDAVKAILQARVESTDIDPETISHYLYHPEVPPLDMIIRTSGEQRLSNFMLWRSEYAELKFVDKNWPDFSPEDLQQALDEYKHRHRRLGA